jgi:hypothetical protein
MPLLIEAGGHPVEPIGPIHVVLDVFLARPHDLDRTVNVFGDLNRASDAVDLEPPAESAADQVIVDRDFFQRQTGSLRRRRLGSRQHLGADPDFTAIVTDMDSAIHRLHRRVRQKRNLVDRLDLDGGARHRLVDIADILRNRP